MGFERPRGLVDVRWILHHSGNDLPMYTWRRLNRLSLYCIIGIVYNSLLRRLVKVTWSSVFEDYFLHHFSIGMHWQTADLKIETGEQQDGPHFDKM